MPSKRRSTTKSEAPASPPDDGAGIRVLCVDDHAVIIEGLKAQFSLDPSIRCIGSLSSAERLVEEVGRLKPDLVLLDIEMPGPDAFETADRLRHMHPRTRVVILSAHIRDGYIDAAFKCGAWGYFAKSDELSAIISGIREVACGRDGTFVLGPKVKKRCRPVVPHATGVRPSPPLRRVPAGPSDARPVTPLSTLSMREVEVLRLIGKGLTRNQIASELSREVKTIDGHQKRIMRKLNVGSRSDLMRLAIREGLAEA